MKTLGNHLVIASLTLIFLACEKSDEFGEQQNSESVEAAESEASMEEMSDDIDEIAFYGSDFTQSNGKVAHDEYSPLFCAEITHDIATKTIIIDYGDGCRDRGERERKGKIIITYTAPLVFPGAEVTVTFEDFYIGNVKVEGTRVIKNVSGTLDDFITLEIDFTDGKFIWEDGSVATRNAHWVVKWIRAANPVNDEKHVDGYAEGSTKANIRYSVEITETLIFKRECRPWHVFVPVDGVKVVVWNGRTKTIDYGDGECDRLVNIISSDGISTEVEIRGRFHAKNG